MRRSALLVAAALAGLLAAGAPERRAGAETAAAFAQADNEAIDVFLGNTLLAFYHQLAHALIDALSLPIEEPEEAAADTLATLLLIELDEAHNLSDEIEGWSVPLAAATGWLMPWEQIALMEIDGLPFWTRHALNEDRYRTIVCLVYGSDPKRFDGLAEDAGIDAERAAGCPGEYAAAARTWNRLLGPYRADAAAGEGRTSVRVIFENSPDEAARELRDLLRSAALFESLARELLGQFAFPRPMSLRLAHCREADAAWDSGAATLTVCYELLLALMDIATAH